MKTISKVVDEIAKQGSPNGVPHPEYRKVIEKIVKQACGEMLHEVFFDLTTKKAKIGVTQLVLDRAMKFVEAEGF